jgi:hypothetical protein
MTKRTAALSLYRIDNGHELNGRPECMIVVADCNSCAEDIARATTWPGKVEDEWDNLLTVCMGPATGVFASVTEPCVTSIYGVKLDTWTTR